MKKQKQATFLNTATSIGIQLCREAIWDNGRCNWMTATHIPPEEGNGIYFRPLYNEIYLGSAGVAYFLSALYRVSPDPLFRKTAVGALHHAYSEKGQTEPANMLGFYRGWPGIAYALLYGGRHFEDEQLVKKGLEVAMSLLPLQLSPLKLDIVEGCASAIPVLIKIHRHYPDEGLKNFIYAVADHLLDTADKSVRGWSWKTIEQGNHNLAGFAHGTAGFAYSLMEMYGFSGEDKYREAAYKAMQYEDSYFSEEEQNWPDFRVDTREEEGFSFANAWCHGAPGIGLSRVRTYQITRDEKLKEAAYRAIRTTLNNTMVMEGYNVSFCHGVFGNADLFINGSLAFGDRSLMDTAIRLGKEACDFYPAQGRPWLNGIVNTYQIPGLMLGLAGTGYYYLRLDDPKKFPSVLLINADEPF